MSVMYRLKYPPREMSWSQRYARRGGLNVFSEQGPPVDATAEQLLAWAQESQRRSGLVILACQSARLEGKTYIRHPLTDHVADIELSLACSQQRQMTAGEYMRAARNA